MVQKQADISDYGHLMLVAMTTSCVVLIAVIATAACVLIARRHRLRHHLHHPEADSMSLEGHYGLCPHACQCHVDVVRLTIIIIIIIITIKKYVMWNVVSVHNDRTVLFL